MKKRIVSVLLAIAAVFSITSCGSKETPEPSTTAETATTAPSTTFATTSTTEPETTTLTTVLQTVTELITTATTTKKPTTTTTTKKVTTTAKKTTTLPKYDESKPDGYYKVTQDISRDNLKYGVARRRNVINYIETLPNGKEVIVKQDISEYYNRTFYFATYDDLLPAAKENMDEYSGLINLELIIINGYRAKKGIAPLKLNKHLTEIACARAEEIAWSGKHSHTRPNGLRFASILREAGIRSGTVGENIGWGYATVNEVCKEWKNSPSHYENIMNPNFTEIGIGIAADPDPDRKLCWTQIFM